MKALNAKVLPRDLRSKDSKALVQTIMSQWLPLSSSVLLTVVEKIPTPADAQQVKIPKILYPKGEAPESSSLPEMRGLLEKALYNCDPSDEAPVVAYVSKMFSVSADMLPSRRRVQLTAEEMRERRRLALAKQQAAATTSVDGGNLKIGPEHMKFSTGTTPEEKEVGPMALQARPDEIESTQAPDTPNEETLIGFARIYSGTLKVGQKLQVLGPKYDPLDPDHYRSEVVIEKLYLMMGRELQELQQVPAGNVFGIGGLGEHILKTGTLSSLTECPSFGGVRAEAAPIVRVALEPREPNQMGQLVEGLRQLNQADPCVEVYLQETGEHVIVCAGELHLERCLNDLRERFAKIEIQVSPPIVPFRETISPFPAMPSTQQQQAGANDMEAEQFPATTLQEPLPTGTVVISTPNKLCRMQIRAVPLPFRVTSFLEEQSRTMRGIIDEPDAEMDAKDGHGKGQTFVDRLKAVFEEAYRENEIKDKELWSGVIERYMRIRE